MIGVAKMDSDGVVKCWSLSLVGSDELLEGRDPDTQSSDDIC